MMYMLYTYMHIYRANILIITIPAMPSRVCLWLSTLHRLYCRTCLFIPLSHIYIHIYIYTLTHHFPAESFKRYIYLSIYVCLRLFDLQGTRTIGHDSNLVQETNPLYNIGAKSVIKMMEYFSAQPLRPHLGQQEQEGKDNLSVSEQGVSEAQIPILAAPSLASGRPRATEPQIRGEI